MRARPLTLRQANAFVDQYHRHHDPSHAHRWSIGAEKNNTLVGVAIVARPVAWQVPQYSVAEVVRLATDGTKNACSFLYAACARAAEAMGFDKIQTYILESEPGTSLRAAGWVKEADTAGGSRDRPSRRRVDNAPTEPKQRWAKYLNARASVEQ